LQDIGRSRRARSTGCGRGKAGRFRPAAEALNGSRHVWLRWFVPVQRRGRWEGKSGTLIGLTLRGSRDLSTRIPLRSTLFLGTVTVLLLVRHALTQLKMPILFYSHRKRASQSERAATWQMSKRMPRLLLARLNLPKRVILLFVEIRSVSNSTVHTS